jgi:hypothetical protein
MKRIIVAIILLAPALSLANDAGVPLDAGSGPAALPSLESAPAESASLVWSLYKAGHLVPALIVAAFFVLTLLRGRIAWLRVGYRALGTAAMLGLLGMLAERAAAGETPNLQMFMGAMGAAFAAWLKTEGEQKAAKPVVS